MPTNQMLYLLKLCPLLWILKLLHLKISSKVRRSVSFWE